jgi:malonyl-CoA O-methyltransferase
LIKELHVTGESNAHCERSKGLMGKQALQKLESYYERYRNAFEKLPATFEVIYGHALGTDMLSKLENGEVHIPLSKIGMKNPP